EPGTPAAQPATPNRDGVEAARGVLAPSPLKAWVSEGYNQSLPNDKLQDIKCHHRQKQPIECEYTAELRHSTQHTLHLRATGEMTKRGEHLNYFVRIHDLKDNSLAFQKVIIRYAC